MPLTKQQIQAIPELLARGETAITLARLYECHPTTIRAWVRKLRAVGHKIPHAKLGRPKINLNPPQKND